MKYEQRIAALEANSRHTVQPEKAPANGESIMSAIKKIMADSAEREAFLTSASAAERYRFWQNEIRKYREELAAPFEDKRSDLPGLSRSVFQVKHAGAKSILAGKHYKLRGCEIELLQAADHKVDELIAEHQLYLDMPNRWPYADNHLPKTAQEIIAKALLN
jgi:hypothetical protein